MLCLTQCWPPLWCNNGAHTWSVVKPLCAGSAIVFLRGRTVTPNEAEVLSLARISKSVFRPPMDFWLKPGLRDSWPFQALLLNEMKMNKCINTLPLWTPTEITDKDVPIMSRWVIKPQSSFQVSSIALGRWEFGKCFKALHFKDRGRKQADSKHK